MATFRDSQNREWKLSINLRVLGECREHYGVDLGQAMGSPEKLSELIYGDPERLGRVLWVMVDRQAKEQGVSPEEFSESFDGLTLEQATTALMLAVADFFPRSKITEKIKENLPGLLNEMDEAMIRQIERETKKVTQKLKGFAGS